MTYYCTKFTGYWPVGRAAVVDAPNREEAAATLNFTLQEQGLPGDADPKDCLPLEAGECVVLCDGAY